MSLKYFYWLAATLLGSATVYAQDGAAPAVEMGGESILKSVLRGGPMEIGIWVAIIITSIVMVTFVIQNSIQLRTDKLAPPALIKSLRNAINAGNYQEAWETCQANDNYLANVLKAGLERLGRGREAVGDGIAEHALRETMMLRTRNSYLSVIGVVSPMIGLLGTVIGMMGAFSTLGSRGISDPRGLATSIGQVLMATASGLFIAIPAFIAYYIFRNRGQMCIVQADDRLNRLIEDLPYEELQGLRIGENFRAGLAAHPAEAMESRRVSMALTTNCPVCNGAIVPGQNPCPHCSAALDWST